MALLSFPNPVNEIAARLVAAGVVVLCAVTIIVGQPWLEAVIAYGFLARVATGPKLSPLALLVTRVIVPRLPLDERPVPGPPKRFAQGLGAVMSVGAAILSLGFGLTTASYVLLGAIAIAATLESALGFCIGCRIFAVLMSAGVIPSDVCEACDDIRRGGQAQTDAAGATAVR